MTASLPQTLVTEIVVPTETLHQAIDQLVEQLDQKLQASDDWLALIVLSGAKMFADALLARMQCPPPAAYVRASSYHGTTQSHPNVQLDGNFEQVADKNILLIDDIYDTGRTLTLLTKTLREHNPRTVKTCVLLEKQRPHEHPVHIDYRGLAVPDKFLIGFGLDYQNRYRSLPFVAAIEPDSH